MFSKDDSDDKQASEKYIATRSDFMTSVVVSHGNANTGGGSRAGLFRTPISGGVQSATSAHDLPRPALAVRNLMEQVRLYLWTEFVQYYYI